MHGRKKAIKKTHDKLQTRPPWAKAHAQSKMQNVLETLPVIVAATAILAVVTIFNHVLSPISSWMKREWGRWIRPANVSRDEVVAHQAAMQLAIRGGMKMASIKRDFLCLPLLRRVYDEAPDDVFELIVSECCDFGDDGCGRGGLNAFRLANKRLKQVVESCTTMLTNRQKEDGPDSLPIPIIQRCRRIEVIRCLSHNLRSLEGCLDGLKGLVIGRAPHLSDISPLASCIMMDTLFIEDSSITDISVVVSIPLLNTFTCQKRGLGRPSIKDLSPLSSCTRLKMLLLGGNYEIKDLSPLSVCTNLEELEICGIRPETSLLPLASCTRLKELKCRPDAINLNELMIRRPDLIIYHPTLYKQLVDAYT